MKANVKVPSPLEELDNYMKEEYHAIKKADRIIGGILLALLAVIAAVIIRPEWFW